MLLAYLVIAWLIGLILGARYGGPWYTWLAASALGLLLALLGRRERAWRLGGLLLLAGSLGALRIAANPLYATPLRPYLDNGSATFTGFVCEAPARTATGTDLTLAVQVAQQGPEVRAVHGRILVRVPGETLYRYGDRLRVTGALRTPAELPGFSYRDYLARRGIHGQILDARVAYLGAGAGSRVKAALIAVADRAEALIDRLWPPPESGLLAGILLGREGAIPEGTLEAFNSAGVRHIIAISGFNITLLAGALTAMLLTVLNRRWTIPLVILLLCFYVILVGADPSVLRAGLMSAVALVAALTGRRGQGLTTLAVAALLMTLWQPWSLWEPGFQLSFAATLGLIVLQPPLEAWVEAHWLRAASVQRTAANDRPAQPARGALPPHPAPLPLEGRGKRGWSDARADASLSPREGEGQGEGGGLRKHREQPVAGQPSRTRPRLPGWLREAVLVSLAAQIATLPITLGTFGRLSLVSPLANLLVLPVQAALMELGALATVLGLLWQPLGRLLAWVAWPFAAYTLRVTGWLGGLPWASVDVGTAGSVLPWLLYLLVAALWLLRDKERRARVLRRVPTAAVLTGLSALALTVWVGGVAHLPDGKLHVTFLDVGQGDAILIRTPAGRYALVDGGPDPAVLPAAVGRRLYPWQRTLDLVALTHPDEDHLAGLVPLRRTYRIGALLDTDLPRQEASGPAWQQAPPPNTLLIAHAGQVVDLGDGVRLTVLHPGEHDLQKTQSDSNNNGLVLRLTYGRFSVLLTGDLQSDGEAALLADEALPLQSTVLKVAHHGAKEATTQRWLDAVRPQLAVISVGTGNRYGHPSVETLGRLRASGAQVWRTDESGDVEVVTDGEQMWVKAGKEPSK